MRSLDVYVAGRKSALLTYDNGEYRFEYLPGTSESHAVSLGLPVTEDYSGVQYMMVPPPLQVGFPEGVLLETIYRLAGKALKLDEDIDILALVGRNMVGRVQMVPAGEPLSVAAGEGQSLPVIRDAGQLLDEPDTKKLLVDAIERFAAQTGLSGMFPKAAAENMSAPHGGTLSFAYGDSIVKLETDEYLGVAVIEHACLSICRSAGIPTVESQLSENGEALRVKRFDVLEDGGRLGFEDFCGLLGNARTAKYSGDLKNIAQVMDAYILDPEMKKSSFLQFFQTTVMNTVLRNGDAHLKNFGMLYEDTTKDPFLAPAYDIVCTTAWLPHDLPALPMNGLRGWPDANALRNFGRDFCRLDDEAVTRVFEDTLAALRSSDVLLDDLQAKYQAVVELQHLREVVERSKDMLLEDALLHDVAITRVAAYQVEWAFHNGTLRQQDEGPHVSDMATQKRARSASQFAAPAKELQEQENARYKLLDKASDLGYKIASGSLSRADAGPVYAEILEKGKQLGVTKETINERFSAGSARYSRTNGPKTV
ncbi:type II toxin-antitoxin system HipA family toxin [Acidithiobacillus sp. VAN18-1]|uniref:Type II toxin-antitoxin system HipA family toxin n=1 Tax=Igneacidithiobacillus copahuensis TaxID=2724909 RepID=A0AAE2YRC6_9PROT|nr:type II toxin-antitoxin system HipA family toxin [Igneacidithiobacillus copahuensis]MBU2788623.1 type II toxin-antitoxin system HipA family toxin [Igneacidithiobacillus copahuensis]MBU2796693.1 type II toxin-antitoxin system HipA family toxin [Acidithiobacillus sp. VAN18-2]